EDDHAKLAWRFDHATRLERHLVGKIEASGFSCHKDGAGPGEGGFMSTPSGGSKSIEKQPAPATDNLASVSSSSADPETVPPGIAPRTPPPSVPMCSVNTAGVTVHPGPTDDALRLQAESLLSQVSWSQLDAYIFPHFHRRLKEKLPELELTFARLRELRADEDIVCFQVMGNYKKLHDGFHQSPELSVGNFTLAFTATLMSHALSTFFSGKDAVFGSFVECWLFSMRGAEGAVADKKREILGLFLHACETVSYFLPVARQSTQLCHLIDWRRGGLLSTQLLRSLAVMQLGQEAAQPCQADLQSKLVQCDGGQDRLGAATPSSTFDDQWLVQALSGVPQPMQAALYKAVLSFSEPGSALADASEAVQRAGWHKGSSGSVPVAELLRRALLGYSPPALPASASCSAVPQSLRRSALAESSNQPADTSLAEPATPHGNTVRSPTTPAEQTQDTA
ncbi:unnamed protein product, partial [Symbiodinium sp. CCMP2456]